MHYSYVMLYLPPPPHTSCFTIFRCMHYLYDALPFSATVMVYSPPLRYCSSTLSTYFKFYLKQPTTLLYNVGMRRLSNVIT